MKKSKLLTVVLAAALMLSNIACACVASAMTSENSSSEERTHHHPQDSNSAESVACGHADCEGCDKLQDSCATPEYTIVSAERDSRITADSDIDPDFSDWDLVYSGADPPQHLRTPTPELTRVFIAPLFPSNTPINRKDQLIE